MKIRIAVALSTLLVAGTVVAQPKTLKLGCYAPLTGPLAVYGKSMAQGLEMALADFAATGKVKGLMVSASCQDDQNRADDGINLARRYIEDKDVVAVLGGWSSTVTLAAGPVYNEAKLVNITPVSSHPDVTKVGPYVYRQSVIQSKEGAANAEYLIRLGAKKIAMIGIPNDYGKANMALTGRAFTAKGGEVVFEEFVRPDAQDFRQVLLKASRANPDMIYMGMFAPQASLLVKQARQLGLKTPLYGAAALDSREFTRLAGEAAEGVRLQLVFNPVVGPKMAEFFKRYEKQYGNIPELFAVNTYITATLLLGVIAEQYPDVTRESIRRGLDAVRRIETIAGPLTYDPTTREWDFRFLPGLIENGQYKPAG